MITEMSEKICSALYDLGFEFHWEANNRGGQRSRYIYVRRPFPIKIRISNHKSDRIEKDKKTSRNLVFDVGPHSMSASDIIQKLYDWKEHGPPNAK